MEPSNRDREIWIDGALVPWESATVHLLSHSHQRGSLVFDYMSVHDTPRGAAVFRLDDHVTRFMTSCELVGLPLEYSPDAVRAGVLAAVRANPGARAAKVSAYLPSIEIDVVPVDAHVSLAVAAYDPLKDIAAHKKGARPFREHLRLFVEREKRNRRPDIIPAQAKVAANYVSPMVAKWRARQEGYDEIVLLDEAGGLAEGPTTNLFVIDGQGRVCTPPEDRVLLGVTRSSVIALAKNEGIEVVEAPLHVDDLYGAAEAFMTGTTAGVWPVESVDGKALGSAPPGPVTEKLRQRFRQVVCGEDPAFAHWLTPVVAGQE